MFFEIDDFTLKFLESKNNISYADKKHILLEIEMDDGKKEILVFNYVCVLYGFVRFIRLTPRDDYLNSKKQIEIGKNIFDEKISYGEYEWGIAGFTLTKKVQEFKKCKISLYIDDYV